MDPPLDLADLVQVRRQPAAVASRKLAVQSRDLIHHGIQQTPRLPPARRALAFGGAVAEQFLEMTSGLCSIGSGEVAVRQEIVSRNGLASLPASTVSSMDGSDVSWPIARAAA